MFVFEDNGVVKSSAVNPTVLERYKDVVAYEVTPPEDKQFREAWAINAGKLEVNLVKAKEIQHTRRRANRDELLSPLDREGLFVTTNATRKTSIRSEKLIIMNDNAVIQLAIDAATSIEELKVVII